MKFGTGEGNPNISYEFFVFMPQAINNKRMSERCP